MAYLRWGSSYWYVYWDGNRSINMCEGGTCDDQWVAVNCVTTTSYKQLKDDFDAAVESIVHALIEHAKEPIVFLGEEIAPGHPNPPLPSNSDIAELKTALRKFMYDVEKEASEVLAPEN